MTTSAGNKRRFRIGAILSKQELDAEKDLAERHRGKHEKEHQGQPRKKDNGNLKEPHQVEESQDEDCTSHAKKRTPGSTELHGIDRARKKFRRGAD